MLGPSDSRRIVTDAGGVCVEPGAAARVLVIADDDGYDLRDGVEAALNGAVRCVEAGGAFHGILANPDLVYPRRRGDMGLTAGAVALLIEAGLRVRFGERAPALLRLGKPGPDLFAEAMRRWGEPDRARVVMIGDQLGTDILGARAFGIDSVLVGTGLTPLADADREAATSPTWTMAAFGRETRVKHGAGQNASPAPRSYDRSASGSTSGGAHRLHREGVRLLAQSEEQHRLPHVVVLAPQRKGAAPQAVGAEAPRERVEQHEGRRLGRVAHRVEGERGHAGGAIARSAEDGAGQSPATGPEDGEPLREAGARHDSSSRASTRPRSSIASIWSDDRSVTSTWAMGFPSVGRRPCRRCAAQCTGCATTESPCGCRAPSPGHDAPRPASRAFPGGYRRTGSRGSRAALRTGANERRWTGHGPSRPRASTWALTPYPLCRAKP